MPAQHTAAAGRAEQRRRCSRCQAEKPPRDFYRNPASICKPCHNAATGLRSRARRAAIALLVSAHRDEFRRLLAAERARRAATPEQVIGGGEHVA
jgi:recombinational DNA repair protein (RecF pathway)